MGGTPFSRFVNGPAGWATNVAIMSALVSAALGVVALRPVWRERASVRVLLMVGITAMLTCLLFHADPPGRAATPSISEVVHGVAGWFGFLMFPPVALLVAASVARLRWVLRALAGVATLLTVLIVAVWFRQWQTPYAFGFGDHLTSLGLVERALFVVDLVTMAVAGWALSARRPA